MLAGCSNEQPQEATNAQTGKSSGFQQKMSNYKVDRVAWLEQKLPRQTLAYFRLPTLWDWVFSPKGDMLHPVQVMDEHKAQIDAMKTGLVNQYIDLVPPPFQGFYRLVIDEIDSPIEVAMLEPDDGSATPNFVLGMTLANHTRDSFGDLLQTAMDMAGNEIRIITPYNAEGLATMVVGPSPVYLKFSEDDGRLLILTGLSASDELIKEIYARDTIDLEHSAVYRFEQSVDASGRNFAMWADIDGLYNMFSFAFSAEEQAVMEMMNIDDMDFVWFGVASKGGQSEIILHASMPEAGFRYFMPRLDQSLDLKVAGNVSWAARLAIPTYEQYMQAHDFIIGMDDEEGTMAAASVEIKSKMDEWLGFDAGNLLRAYGPEITVVSDESGVWTAYQVRDQSMHREITARLETRVGSTVESKNLAGVPIKSWKIATNRLMTEFDEAMGGEQPQLDPVTMAFLETYQQLHTHLYWVQEGDYLVYGSVPQVLADRENHPNPGRLANWLSANSLRWDNTIMGVATEVENLPQTVYHGYLTVMLFLGDLMGHEIDLFTLPTSDQLQLPDSGRLGLRMDSSANAFSIRFSYNYSALEMFSGGSTMTTVAVIGILAAIAIPAYQDFQVRSEVAEYLANAGALRSELTLFYYDKGRLPNLPEAQAIMADYDEFLSYDVDTATIWIEIPQSASSQIAGMSIKMMPDEDSTGSIYWTCGSTSVAPRYLPGSCQDY